MISSTTYAEALGKFTAAFHILVGAHIIDDITTREEPNKFLATLCVKVCDVMESSIDLIKDVDTKPRNIPTLFLIYRACMLDMIHAMYIVDKDDDTIEQKRRVELIMGDHIRSVYKALSEDEKKETRIEYAEYFDGENFRKDKRLPVTPELVRAMEQNLFIDIATRSYEQYSTFSKFEHNGFYTLNIILHSYDQENAPHFVAQIYYAIELIIVSITLIIRHWLDSDSPAYNCLVNIAQPVFLMGRGIDDSKQQP